MALSSWVGAFLLVFIVQMPVAASRNISLGVTELELLNRNATLQIEQFLLNDYNRAIEAVSIVKSAIDRCTKDFEKDFEGFCKDCARVTQETTYSDRLLQNDKIQPEISLEEKIVRGLWKIGKTIEHTGKKQWKTLATNVKRVLQKAKKVFHNTKKSVKGLIKDASNAVDRGYKAVYRGVTRLVRRVRIRIRRFVRLPRVSVRRITLRVRLPRWRLPRVRLPRVRLPRIRLPRVRLPRVRLPRVRLPRVRQPRVRLPRVRLPRVRVRIGRRWGKKKKREVNAKSIDDYIQEAERDLDERSAAPLFSSCSVCDKDSGFLFTFNKTCGETLERQRQLETVLNTLEAIGDSEDESAVIQDVLYDTQKFSMDFETRRVTFPGIYVTTSLGGQTLSFRSRVSYSFDDDEQTLVTKGEAITRETYARYVGNANRILNSILGKNPKFQ